MALATLRINPETTSQGTGVETVRAQRSLVIFPQGRSVNVTQVLSELYKDMASDCFSRRNDESVFQLDVEKLRCDEIVAAIHLRAPASTSELATLDILADETQSVIDHCQVELARLRNVLAYTGSTFGYRVLVIDRSFAQIFC